jgi:hypothetical protein
MRNEPLIKPIYSQRDRWSLCIRKRRLLEPQLGQIWNVAAEKLGDAQRLLSN